MTDSFAQFFEEAGRKLEQLERDTKPVEPRAHVLPGDEDIMGRILDAYRLIESAPPMRTEPIKLTEQQIAAIRAQQPDPAETPWQPSGVVADLFAVPIVRVDTFEESTPFLEAPMLTAEERDRLIRRWTDAHAGARNAHQVTYLGQHPLPWWKRAYYRMRRWLA
jgi:hypothetical protein